MSTMTIPPLRKAQFVPEGFRITKWEEVEKFYTDLLNRSINSAQELEKWVKDRNELTSFVTETFAWRYIKITADGSNEEAALLYQEAVEELAPKIASIDHLLNERLVKSPFLKNLGRDKYSIYLRHIKNTVSLFREANIPILTEVQLKSKEHGKIFSEMTIGVDGKNMTLQKAGTLLEETNRHSRETVYHKINQRILQDSEQLERLFDELLQKRHQMSLNAGFDNFRDYRFQALGRFDYTVEDCYDFHDSIEHEILPLVNQLNDYRRKSLGLNTLRPWDLSVDTSGQSPLRPFNNIDELVDKTVQCLSSLDPIFGHIIAEMRDKKHLDLDARKRKRPGAYNMPLPFSGVPFVFMNATNSLNDVRTLMHESGHAIHSFLTRHYELYISKRVPSEVAELASMTMELLSMDSWDIFFDNEDDLKRAKINQLENVLRILPWIATVDKFQHWIYTNHTHSPEKRKRVWIDIFRKFSSNLVKLEDLEHYTEYLWHKQLHVFEVPFYYIEYGMAQLGAIAIWKNYRQAPEKTVQHYIDALRLGYTRPIGEIYQTAGISFNFSRDYVHELGAFVKSELDSLTR